MPTLQQMVAALEQGNKKKEEARAKFASTDLMQILPKMALSALASMATGGALPAIIGGIGSLFSGGGQAVADAAGAVAPALPPLTAGMGAAGADALGKGAMNLTAPAMPKLPLPSVTAQPTMPALTAGMGAAGANALGKGAMTLTAPSAPKLTLPTVTAKPTMPAFTPSVPPATPSAGFDWSTLAPHLQAGISAAGASSPAEAALYGAGEGLKPVLSNMARERALENLPEGMIAKEAKVDEAGNVSLGYGLPATYGRMSKAEYIKLNGAPPEGYDYVASTKHDKEGNIIQSWNVVKLPTGKTLGGGNKNRAIGNLSSNASRAYVAAKTAIDTGKDVKGNIITKEEVLSALSASKNYSDLEKAVIVKDLSGGKKSSKVSYPAPVME